MANSPDYTPIYQAAADEWNVDPGLLQAVAGQEHGGTSNVSPAGAQGHMQIMPGTQKDLGVTDPNDVTQSIYGGAKYLSQLLDRYKNAPDPASAAVAAYNAGPTRVDAVLAGKATLPAETGHYVPAVAARYKAVAQPPAASSDQVDPLAQKMASLRAQGSIPAPDQQDIPSPAVSDPFSEALAAAPPVAAAPLPIALAQPAPAETDPFSQALAQPDAPVAAVTPIVAAAAGQPTAPAAQSGYHVFGVELPSATNLAEGAGHAVLGASRGLYGLLDKADQAVPSLNGINQAIGMNPPAAMANLDAQDRAYQSSGTGNTLMGEGGNLIGQGVLFAPAGGLIGAGAKAAGAGIGAVAPVIAANPLMRIAGYGAAGAGEGAAFGAVNSDGQPIGQSVAQGAIGGGILGAAVPAVGAAIRGGAGMLANAVTDVTPEAAALAQRARDAYGIDIHAGQITPDGFIKTADNQLGRLPGTGGAAASAKQQAQFTSAVAKTIDPNSTTTTIGRDFMQAQQKRIGGVLNTIESNNNVNFDQTFVNDLAKIESNANAGLTKPEEKVVRKQINGVLQNVKTGDTIDGETFGNLIHKGSPLDRALGNENSNISNYAGDIKDALRGAMQRSLPPDEAAAYQDARFRYKNLMTVAPLVDGPNPGSISPAALAGRVKANFGSDRVFSPATPLDELAQIGQRFLKEPANSGTPDRTVVNRLMVDPVSTIGSGITGLGSLGASAISNPLYTAAGVGGAAVAAGAAGLATRGIGNALRSNYLANRLISGSLNTPAPSSVPNMFAGRLGLPNALTWAAGSGAIGNRLAQGYNGP